MAQAKDIREKVLWVIQSQENQKGGGGTDLRVIQWIIEGKPTKPALEKRDWFLSDDGDRKLGKAKGMTAGDLYLIVKNLKAIGRLLEIKPDHLDEALQLAMFAEESPGPKASTSKSSANSSTTASAPKPSSASNIPPEPVAAGSKAPDVKF